MNRFTICRAMLALPYAALLALPAHADQGTLEDARQLYEDCHWSQAFDAFARLAGNGNMEAARIASLMIRHGPALYFTSFRASAAQVARWQTASATTVQASRSVAAGCDRSPGKARRLATSLTSRPPIASARADIGSTARPTPPGSIAVIKPATLFCIAEASEHKT